MARNCFAYGCNSGYRSTIAKNKALGKKNPSLFSAPKEIDVLEKWQRAIPRKDKIFQRPLKLCELHFDEEDIIRTFETVLPDGTRHIIYREITMLKPGAIPTKFHNVPKYLSCNKRKRKAPTSRSFKCQQISDNETVDDNSGSGFNHLTYFSELHNIEKPDASWIICNNVESVICLKLDEESRCERHIVVAKDSSVKIYLMNKLIKLSNECKTENVEDISLLLKKVDELVICNQLKSWPLSKCCLGYVSEITENLNVCNTCMTNTKRDATKEQQRIHRFAKRKLSLAQQRKYVVSLMKEALRKAYTECKNVKEEVLKDAISDLPQEQQIAINACVQAAKVKDKKSVRYSVQWIYECLLL